MTTISSYSTLWTHVHVEFPQDTRAAKSAGRKFLRALKSLGVAHLVKSRGHVCGLLCCRTEKVAAILRPLLPPDGRMQLIAVTDKQFERSSVTWGRVRTMSDCAEASSVR